MTAKPECSWILSLVNPEKYCINIMKITWEVSDGYCGGSRPHTVDIDDIDLEDCENEAEREELIEEYIQNAFEQTISWSIISRD